MTRPNLLAPAAGHGILGPQTKGLSVTDLRDFPFPTQHRVRPDAPAASLCVYCGSRTGNSPAYAEMARELGERLAHQGITLVYGGGSIGMMGVIANACLDAGGQVTGIIPDFLDRLEVGHTGLTERVVVSGMHERKRVMIERADAFAALPGGLGTLDELAEAITWRQLALHAKPVYLLGDADFWQPFVALIDHFRDTGFAHETAHSLFTRVPDIDTLMGHLTHG